MLIICFNSCLSGDSRRMSISSMSPDAVGYNSYEESLVLEERLCLIQLIEETLKTAKSKLGSSDILIPRDLIRRVSQDVITMSQIEPSGLRGCVLVLNLVSRTMCRKLGRIDCDPCTVATFELHVNFSEDEKKWFSLRKVIPVMEKFFSTKQNPVLFSSAYQIEKRKLYRRSSEF